MDEKDPQAWNPTSYTTLPEIKMSEYSKWQCYLFGGTPTQIGPVWRPNKGQEPNWFWRWMQFLAFGNHWIKDKE